MGGLGLRMVGGALAGIGDGILADAKAKKETMLLQLEHQLRSGDQQANWAHEERMQQQKYGLEKTTDLTPEDVAARGLPVGTVAQKDYRGTINVVSKPDQKLNEPLSSVAQIEADKRAGRFASDEDYQAAKDKALGETDNAPSTRTRIAGDEEVVEQWNKKTRQYDEVSRGPRYKPAGTQAAVDDPITQSWMKTVLAGNATMQQVPMAYRNGVTMALTSAPKAAYAPIAANRFSRASTAIISNYEKLPQYQLTANGLPYLQRIDAALQTPGSVSDQDLLDSLTKLNTAGNAVTDAQVKVITEGKSFADTVNVFANRFKNGGVLAPNQREQIHQIAQAIYANYQKGYQPVYDQVAKKLRDSGIPEPFWSLPDLNNLAASAGYPMQGSSPTPEPSAQSQMPARSAAAPAPAAGPSAASASRRGPPVGTVVNGYRFKGGDGNDQAAWERIQ
jgi:hypothetical protein